MAKIAATATVDKSAELAPSVVVGPGCYVGPNVVIDEDTELRMNVCVVRDTAIGKRNIAHANVVLGDDPQMASYAGQETRLIIGDDNIFREQVTINRGSPEGGGVTRIGNEIFFMVGAHIGHDVEVQDHGIIGNYFQVAGHCRIEDHVYISAQGGIHQYVTIGRFAFVGGLTGTTADVPPFVRVHDVYPMRIRGINVVGLQRAGVSESSVRALQGAFRELYKRKDGRGVLNVAEEMLQQGDLDEYVRYLAAFILRSAAHRSGRHLQSLRTH